VTPTHRISAEQLYYVDWLSTDDRDHTECYATAYPSQFAIRTMRERVLSRLKSSKLIPNEEGQRRYVIYVSRRDSQTRSVTNEQLLTSALAAEFADDFKIFVGAHQTLLSQVELFSQADIVLGPHGSGTQQIDC
jgi:capsular polysaccharide biosynthesis protein